MCLWFHSLLALVYTSICDPQTILLLGKKRYLKVYFAVHVALYSATRRLYRRDTTDILAQAIELIVCGFDGIVDELDPPAAREFLRRTERVLISPKTNLPNPPDRTQEIFFARLRGLARSTRKNPRLVRIMIRTVRALTAEHLSTPVDTLTTLQPYYQTAGIHCIFELLVELEGWQFTGEEERLIRAALDLGSVALRILDDALDVVYLRLGWLTLENMENRNLLKRQTCTENIPLRQSLRLAISTSEELVERMQGYLAELSSTRYRALLVSMRQSLTLYPRYVLPLLKLI